MRRAVTGTLVVVATILLVVASIGWWADRVLLSSQRFSDHTVEVLQDPDVQEALTQAITRQISQAAGRDVRLAEPVIGAIVREVVTSTTFQGIFANALTRVHHAVVSGQATDAVLNLSATVDDVRAALKQVAPELAAKIPKGKQIRVTALDRTQLGIVDHVTSLTRTGIVVISILTFVVFGLAFAVSPRRWRTMKFAGWSVFVGFAALAVVQLAGKALLGGAISDPVNSSASQATYRVMTRGILFEAILLGAIGLAVGLMGGWIDRHGGWSAVRDLAGRGATWVRSQVPDGSGAPATAGGAPEIEPGEEPGAVVTAGRALAATVLAARIPTPGRRVRATHWWRAAVLLVVGLWAVASPTGLVRVLVVLAGIGLCWLALTEALAAWAAPREDEPAGAAGTAGSAGSGGPEGAAADDTAAEVVAGTTTGSDA